MTKTIQFTKKNLNEVCAFIGGKSGQRFVARPPGAIGVLLKSKDTKWIKPGDWLVKGRDGWCKVKEGELPVKKRECQDCGEDMERHQNLRTCGHCGLKVCGFCYTHCGHHPIFHDPKCGGNPNGLRTVPPQTSDEKIIVKVKGGGSIAIPRSVMEASGVSSSQASSGGDMVVDTPPQRLGHHLSGHKLLSADLPSPGLTAAIEKAAKKKPKCQGPNRTSLDHAGELAPVQLRVSNRVNQWKPGIVKLCQNCRKLLNGGWRYVKPFPGTDSL